MPFADVLDILNDIRETQNAAFVDAVIDFFNLHVFVTYEPDAGVNLGLYFGLNGFGQHDG